MYSLTLRVGLRMPLRLEKKCEKDADLEKHLVESLDGIEIAFTSNEFLPARKLDGSLNSICANGLRTFFL